MKPEDIKVKINYRNKNMDIVDTQEYSFDLYCGKLSRDIINMLSSIESFFNAQYIEGNISDDMFYRQIRHRLFDIAGAVKRIPENLEMNQLEPKATKKAVFNFLGKK